MSTKPYRTQYLLAAAADHEILTQGVASFRNLFVGEYGTNAAQEFAALHHLLGQKLTEHFAYEEEQVFPSLLADRPTDSVAKTISELRREHITLSQVASNLNERLTHRTLTTCTGELWMALLHFFELLVAHIAKEAKLFRRETVAP